MKEKIHQMQIVFAPVQDRLMLRVKTTDRTEFKLWLTRRYVKLLWQALQKMLGRTQPGIIQDSQTKQAVLSFEHEQALAKMDFKTPYQEGSEVNRPLGDDPVLVSNIQIKPGPGNTQLLSMNTQKGKGVNIALDPNLLHSFCKILADGVKKTDWDLEFKVAHYTAPVSMTSH